jgi:penicillin amidase
MADWLEELRKVANAALPPVEGEIAVPGLSQTVEVIRDPWGVPHIYASTVDDLFLAQGFVVASERLFQLDAALRLANGRLATMFGELVLPSDRFARTVGWNRAGARIAASYDDRSIRIAASFRAGVRAWLEAMPVKPIQYTVLDLEPDLPEDEGSWTAPAVYAAWGLSGNWENELLRSEIAARLGWEAMLDLFPDLPTEPAPIVAGKLPRRASAIDLLNGAPPRPPGQGSNNWVVAGSRTTSGKPLLANDPHLIVQTPSVWFEVHLSAPGYEASGVAFPFTPGIVIGHTPHHAWGFTNVGGDTQDLYLERLNKDRTAALYEGAWEPTTAHREEIDVRGRAEPEILDVVETRHGPILDTFLMGVSHGSAIEGHIEETYALRWTGHEFGAPPSSSFGMATARSFEEFREAARDWACPGQNIVYADVDGAIGYQCTGQYPIRRRGDGTLPVPGWTSEFEWDGYIPFEELPWCENPDEGFLATANNKTHDGSYPHLIGHDFMPPFRVRRIVELISDTEKHSRESFAAMQMDTVSLPAREVVRRLHKIEPRTDRQREVLALLDGWEGDLAADSAAACLFEVWSKHAAHEILLPRLGEDLFTHYYGRRQWTNAFQFQVLPNILAFPTTRWFGRPGITARDDLLRGALDAAIDELSALLGPEPRAWRWGAIHKVVFASPIAMIGDLSALFTAGVVEMGGDEQTICAGSFEPGSSYEPVVISSWRQIVDLSDLDASVGVHTTGQSGHPASPHWNDQVQMWARGEYHPLPITREAVEAASESAAVLLPR